MKNLSLFIFSFFGSLYFCYGQTIYKLDKDTAKFKNQPLFILKRPLREPLETTNMVVDKNDIDSINVYKYPLAEKSYGITGKTTVVDVILKNGSSIVAYDKLLENFNIDNTSNNLPVYIDSAIAYRPQKTYFELTGIKYVKLEIEEETGMQYISVRTNSPINRSAPPMILDDPDKKNN